MKRSPARARLASRSAAAAPARLGAEESVFDLRWTHAGTRYRVTPWPELRFECEAGEGGEDGWTSFEPDPSSETFAEGAAVLGRSDWQRFLDFMPREERDFVERFKVGRLAALAVLARCPELCVELAEAPALVALLAAHRVLRGMGTPRWGEIRAVFERNGIFGVLEWLGLPASRQTLAILGRIADPDLPRRLWEPMRTSLWEPARIWRFERATTLTERELVRCCHALAA